MMDTRNQFGLPVEDDRHIMDGANDVTPRLPTPSLIGIAACSLYVVAVSAALAWAVCVILGVL